MIVRMVAMNEPPRPSPEHQVCARSEEQAGWFARWWLASECRMSHSMNAHHCHRSELVLHHMRPTLFKSGRIRFPGT